MTDEELIKKFIEQSGAHIDTFSGHNCHELEDNNCTGWEVGERRCDCGNRRVWFVKDKDGNVWAEAW